MQTDYVMPGSPLDEYLFSLGGQFESGTCDDTERGSSTFALNLRQRFYGLCERVVELHRIHASTHSSKNLAQEILYTKRFLELTINLLDQERAEEIEEWIYVKERMGSNISSPVADVSITAPLAASHLIWVLNFGLDSALIYKAFHGAFFLFIFYVLLLHLRSELLYWRRKNYLEKLSAHVLEMCELFKRCDYAITRALRLVRDISVIAKGNATINSRSSLKAHVSMKLKNDISTCVKAVVAILDPNSQKIAHDDSNNKFELEFLAYEETRSNYLYEFSLSHLYERDYLDLRNALNDQVLILEAHIEFTRRGKKPADSVKTDFNFSQATQQSLYRSLSLHARQVAEYAYQGEKGEVDLGILTIHVTSLNQNLQLLIDYRKDTDKKDNSVQVEVEKTTIECQTSIGQQSLLPINSGTEDMRDDEVLECLAGENKFEISRAVDCDEIDEKTKQASFVVFSELKSILHKQVNPEKRQKRKEELFPEYWAKAPKQTTDNIIPDEVSLFDFEDEQENSSSDVANEQPDSSAYTLENEAVESNSGPLLFDDELERRKNISNHVFCCSSDQLSIAQLVAKQAANKCKTSDAVEYLYGSDD